MAWPGEVIEERAADIAEAADALLRSQGAWRHRRVETITVLNHEHVRRHVSIDFTVPDDQREGLRLSAEEFAVPLALLAKRPLVHFDMRNEEQHSIPLLTADQHRTIARELLYRQLESDEAGDAVMAAAGDVIEAVLADEPAEPEPEIAALEEAYGVELADFRATASVLSRYFIVWATVRGLERRRVYKLAFDEPFTLGPNFVFFIGASGCSEALSYHFEVVIPADLKARSTRLVDAATGAQLTAAEPDTDRPALYLRAETPPQQPEVVVHLAVERWRFLAPAALVASIIALLVAPPFLFGDLTRLPDTAGAAIGLVLSTSAVFSVLVLRTDEHPLLRLMLVRGRALLAASTVAVLFAAASIGFRTAGWIIETTWAIAALVSVVTAGILIIETLRAPR